MLILLLLPSPPLTPTNILEYYVLNTILSVGDQTVNKKEEDSILI